MAEIGTTQREWNIREHNNHVRVDGLDRCYCGCKYWENDTCIDCGGTEPAPDDEWHIATERIVRGEVRNDLRNTVEWLRACGLDL
jgi:hypothetical protein